MPPDPNRAELSAWLRLSLENVGPATACTLLSALGPSRSTRSGLGAPPARALARQLAAPMPADMQAQVERSLECRGAGPPHPDAGRSRLSAKPADHFRSAHPADGHGQAGLPARPGAGVGARSATPGGQENARLRPPSGIAWLARGQRTGPGHRRRARSALDAGAQGGGTVAVMGTGIDRIYPAATATRAPHRRAWRAGVRAAAGRGRAAAALSQAQPHRGRPARGVVVEAARQSGSLITAPGRRMRPRGLRHSGLHPFAAVARLPCADPPGREAGGDGAGHHRRAGRLAAAVAPGLARTGGLRRCPPIPCWKRWASIRCTWTPSRPAAAGHRTCKRSWSTGTGVGSRGSTTTLPALEARPRDTTHAPPPGRPAHAAGGKSAPCPHHASPQETA